MWPVEKVALAPISEGIIPCFQVADCAVGLMKVAISAVMLAGAALAVGVFHGCAEPRRMDKKELTSHWRRRDHYQHCSMFLRWYLPIKCTVSKGR